METLDVLSVALLDQCSQLSPLFCKRFGDNTIVGPLWWRPACERSVTHPQQNESSASLFRFAYYSVLNRQCQSQRSKNKKIKTRTLHFVGLQMHSKGEILIASGQTMQKGLGTWKEDSGEEIEFPFSICSGN